MHLVQLKVLDKVLSKRIMCINLVYVVICDITKNVEQNSDEISYEQDYHDKL